MTTDWEALRQARVRLPVGDRVRGTVSLVPKPGAIGVFVELDGPVEGFVDGLALPHDVERWPVVGATTEFEILGHHLGQVRLWPLDRDCRDDRVDAFHLSDETTWARVISRYRPGQLVEGRTTHVFVADHSFSVTFDDQDALPAWGAPPPVLNETATYRITAILDTTHRILLAPM